MKAATGTFTAIPNCSDTPRIAVSGTNPFAPSAGFSWPQRKHSRLTWKSTKSETTRATIATRRSVRRTCWTCTGSRFTRRKRGLFRLFVPFAGKNSSTVCSFSTWKSVTPGRIDGMVVSLNVGINLSTFLFVAEIFFYSWFVDIVCIESEAF